jgi:hypothetical protein
LNFEHPHPRYLKAGRRQLGGAEFARAKVVQHFARHAFRKVVALASSKDKEVIDGFSRSLTNRDRNRPCARACWWTTRGNQERLFLAPERFVTDALQAQRKLRELLRARHGLAHRLIDALKVLRRKLVTDALPRDLREALNRVRRFLRILHDKVSESRN